MTELSDLGKACFFEALRKYRIAYWNINQEEWEDYLDTRIDNFYTLASRDGEIEPNFSDGIVEFSWYKHPGRSMTINKELTAEEWACWITKTVASIEGHYNDIG